MASRVETKWYFNFEKKTVTRRSMSFCETRQTMIWDTIVYCILNMWIMKNILAHRSSESCPWAANHWQGRHRLSQFQATITDWCMWFIGGILNIILYIFSKYHYRNRSMAERQRKSHQEPDKDWGFPGSFVGVSCVVECAVLSLSTVLAYRTDIPLLAGSLSTASAAVYSSLLHLPAAFSPAGRSFLTTIPHESTKK